MIKNTVTIVVTDLDGTLLNSEKKVTEQTKQAIKKLKEKGILFGLASGRSVESVLTLSEEWGISKDISFIVGMNGGAFYDIRQDFKENYFMLDGSVGLDLMDFYDGMDVLYWVLDGDVRYTNKSREDTRANAILFNEKEVEVDMREFLQNRKISKFMLMYDPSYGETVKKKAEYYHNPVCVGFSTANYLFEYVDPRVNKGTGVEKICEHFGCKLENVVAFGDELNDLEMLKKVGMGVCMKNGLDEVKAISNYVSPYTNDEDALAHFINEYILMEE